MAKHSGEPNNVMFTDFVTHAKRRWWFIAAVAVLVLLGVVTTLAVRDEETYTRTAHFVLHPDADMPATEVPPALDVLDGTIVQTLLRVLNNEEILERAATSGGLDGTDGLALDATVQPGSAYFDAAVRGNTEADVDAAAASLGPVAARYVDESYEGYDLTLLGTDAETHSSFPPSPAVVTLSLLFGALLAVALLFVEWCAHRLDFTTGVPRVRLADAQVTGRDAVPAAAAVPAPDAVPAPEAVPAAAAPAKKAAARKPRTTKPRTTKPRAASTTTHTRASKPKAGASTTKSRSTAPPPVRDGETGAPAEPPEVLDGETDAPAEPPEVLDGETDAPAEPPEVRDSEAGAPAEPPEVLDSETGAPAEPPEVLDSEAGASAEPPPVLDGKAAESAPEPVVLAPDDEGTTPSEPHTNGHSPDPEEQPSTAPQMETAGTTTDGPANANEAATAP